MIKMLQMDKHTTDLLERLVIGIEEQNKRLAKIEEYIGYIESMMENSENI